MHCRFIVLWAVIWPVSYCSWDGRLRLDHDFKDNVNEQSLFKKFILSTFCSILKTLCVGHAVVRLHVRFGMVNPHPTLFFFWPVGTCKPKSENIIV